ncbi:hypothetical protein D3C79_759250 [compost metagenome]
MRIGTAVSGQTSRSTGFELKLMSRYRANWALMCSGFHLSSCSTLPCSAATVSGLPAGLVQAWFFSARPIAQGASSRTMATARNDLRARRRGRLHSSAAHRARQKEISHMPPSGARPDRGPSSWL